MQKQCTMDTINTTLLELNNFRTSSLTFVDWIVQLLSEVMHKVNIFHFTVILNQKIPHGIVRYSSVCWHGEMINLNFMIAEDNFLCIPSFYSLSSTKAWWEFMIPRMLSRVLLAKYEATKELGLWVAPKKVANAARGRDSFGQQRQALFQRMDAPVCASVFCW